MNVFYTRDSLLLRCNLVKVTVLLFLLSFFFLFFFAHWIARVETGVLAVVLLFSRFLAACCKYFLVSLSLCQCYFFLFLGVPSCLVIQVTLARVRVTQRQLLLLMHLCLRESLWDQREKEKESKTFASNRSGLALVTNGENAGND